MRGYSGVFVEIMEKAEEFVDRRFNWDGAGGLPMRLDAAASMLDFLAQGEMLDKIERYIPDVEVVLNAAGSIEMSFELYRKELVLTWQCGGIVTWIKILQDNQTSIEGTCEFPDIHDPELSPGGYMEIVKLLTWLIWG